MFSTQSKLRLTGAVAALLSLAFAISCRGFFVNPTWTSITIQPSNPSVAVGNTLSLQAFGIDTDNNHRQITSNLNWSLSNPSNGGTVATISSSGVLTGVNAGTVTITASSEGVSGTATATVAQLVSTMTISPTSNSVTDNGTNAAQFKVTSGSTDITSLVTLTAYLNGTAATGLPCSYNSTSGFQECVPSTGLVPTGQTETFTIIVTYAGYTGTAQVSATLSVTGS